MRVALTWAALLISAALLVRSILTARKPSVVRPVLDVARQILQIVAIVAVVVITGISTPFAVTLIAGILGAVAGGYVGSTLELTVRERRVVARRSIVGAAVWSGGLVAVQVAGLANRAGVMRLGQAVSWFGFGVAVGTFAGRTPGLADARRRIATGAVATTAVWLALAALGTRSSQPADARPVAGAEAGWSLTSVNREPMSSTSFTSISHTPGNVDAEVDSPGFQARLSATYNPVPPEQLGAGDFSTDVEVLGSVSGDIQSYAGLAVIQLDRGGWTGAAVEVGVGCTDPIGDAPLSCAPPARQTGTFTWEVPEPTADATFVLGVGVLNCRCAIFWTYTAGATPTSEPASADSQPRAEEPSDQAGADDADEPDRPGEASVDESGRDGPDDETITEQEALATGIAVVIIGILIGVIDLADTPFGSSGSASTALSPPAPPPDLPPPPTTEPTTAAAARGTPPSRPPPPSGPPPAAAPEPPPIVQPRPTVPPPGFVGVGPDVARIDALADQADQWAIDALPWIGDFDALDDYIRSIRDRAHAGQSLPGDEEMLRAIRDSLWALARASNDATASTEQTNAAILGAFETLMGVEAEFGKAAAGTFGPASATLYAGFVDTIANRDKGLAKALGHGAVGGASAFVGSRAAPALDKLSTAVQALRGGGNAALLNAAEDVGHQAVDAEGDLSQIDLGRTGRAAGTGFVTGAGGQVVGGQLRGAGDVPAPRVPGDPAPSVRPSSDTVPTTRIPSDTTPTPRAPNETVTTTRTPGDTVITTRTPSGTGPTTPPPAEPTLPAPPRRPLDPPVLSPNGPPPRTPDVDLTGSPADAYPRPGPRPIRDPDIDLGSPNRLFPDAPDLPPRVRVRQDADGYFLDAGGNQLARQTPEGLRTPDGTPVVRFISDGRGQPIGYEQADGVQVISFAQPDASRIPTAGGRAIDPDAPPPTGEQPRS